VTASLENINVNFEQCSELKALHIRMTMHSPSDDVFQCQLEALVHILGTHRSLVKFLWLEIETSVEEG